MAELLVLFAVLNAADGWTTWHVFRFGGFERTAWIAKVISTVGLYWALVAFKVGAVAAVWFVAVRYPFDWRILAALDIGYAVQVYWNWKQLQKHKTRN